MRRKRRWIFPIVAGCVVMYATLMFLAVWLMKIKYTEIFKDNLGILTGNLQQELGDKEQIEKENENYTEDMRRNYWQYAANTNAWSGDSRFQQFSVAVYDETGKLAVQTKNCVLTNYANEESGWRTVYECYDLEELTEEELETLAEYDRKSIPGSEAPGEYEISVVISEDKKALDEIYVQRFFWEKGEHSGYVEPLTGSSMGYIQADGSHYALTDSELVWKWERSGVPEEEQEANLSSSVDISFPYMESGYREWEKWRESSYLHDYSGELSFTPGQTSNFFLEELAGIYDKGYKFGREERIRMAVYSSGEWEHRMQKQSTQENLSPICFLEVRSVNEPWLAALYYMKYVLLAGFMLMLLCMGTILYATDRTYRQRAALEETRRDFTNAVAHELKTPLGIIRGFAENLKEHTMEEKREYYLDQIIGQTEEMDGLVAKMIEVSRLDSEHLVLQRDPVSVNDLFHEQMERFLAEIEEKELSVQYEEEGTFLVMGDREYLEKAVWNLWSNAVLYNVPGGSIRIQATPEELRIENTAVPLTEEQLRHAFDLFYSGDKSRSSKEKHMGLGLFLTRRILALHHMEISMESLPDGVSVVLKKKNSPKLLYSQKWTG